MVVDKAQGNSKFVSLLCVIGVCCTASHIIVVDKFSVTSGVIFLVGCSDYSGHWVVVVPDTGDVITEDGGNNA